MAELTDASKNLARAQLTRLKALEAHMNGRVFTRLAKGANGASVADQVAEIEALKWAIRELLVLFELATPPPAPAPPAPAALDEQEA